MSELDIFGTFHIDRPSKVKRELEDFCEDADVLFIESPRNRPNESDEREMLIRNPIFWITGWILEIAWGLLGFVLTGRYGPVDGYATDKVSNEKKIKTEPVDMNLVRRVSEVSIYVTVFSWIWLILTLGLFVIGVWLLAPNIIIWSVLFGLLPIVPLAFGTASERDKLMAENIHQVFSKQENVKQGCLIVGQCHIEGVIEELEDSNVEIGETHKSKFLRQNQ